MKQKLLALAASVAMAFCIAACNKAPAGTLPTVSSPTFGSVPEITFPSSTPPQLPQLQVLDGQKSKGATVKDNDLLVVDYYARVWNGEQLSDSTITDASGPTTLSLAQPPINGWKQLVGKAKVGQRVLLVLPPDQAYGADGNESAGVGANQTIVYVVDVRDAVSPEAASSFQLTDAAGEKPADIAVDWSNIDKPNLSIAPGAPYPLLAKNYLIAQGNGDPVQPGQSLACRILARDYNGKTVIDNWNNQVLTRVNAENLQANGVPVGSLILSVRPATAAGAPEAYLFQVVGSFSTER